MRDYRKIRAWELADELAVLVYGSTRQFPRDETYGLISQVRRSVVSVPTNLCEGSARQSSRDYLHFLYIARASLSETQYLLHLSARLGYLTATESERLQSSVTETFKCLHGLIKSVEKDSSMISRATSVLTSILVIGMARMASQGCSL